jgi:hypothetical protein
MATLQVIAGLFKPTAGSLRSLIPTQGSNGIQRLHVVEMAGHENDWKRLRPNNVPKARVIIQSADFRRRATPTPIWLLSELSLEESRGSSRPATLLAINRRSPRLFATKSSERLLPHGRRSASDATRQVHPVGRGENRDGIHDEYAVEVASTRVAAIELIAVVVSESLF